MAKNKQQKQDGILREIFSSTGDGRTSISKIAMVIGLLVGSYVVIMQTYTTGISYDVFTVYMMSTLGANSVNKAISMVQNIKESKYQHQYSRYDYHDHSVESDESHYNNDEDLNPR